jgi:4-diphosphocytidyl-2-C-methyl-D-erythritol kinase
MKVVERAPAKLNLHLHVGAPESDGRHPLESIVVFADVGDEIEASPAPELGLAIEGPFAAALPDPADNLALRAASRLRERAGVARGAAILLTKNLPVASGIGGGSTDAAAVLRALNALWDLRLPAAQLREIGAGLGADVPACIAARPCWMTGTGEAFTPIAFPEVHAVLVNPRVAVATGDVYRRFDEMKLGGAFRRAAPPVWRDSAEAVAGLSALRNDLTAAAISVAPEIQAALDALAGDARAPLARMSGSGTTVFALTRDAAVATALAAELMRARPEWWVRPTRLGGAA